MDLDLITELERRVTAATGDPQESEHLFQRLSMCTRRYNEIAFRSTFKDNMEDARQ